MSKGKAETVAVSDRAQVLARTQALKMARSAHAYVRGNTAKFYEWLLASPVAAHVPEGPAIWICGDCHLGNLGPIGDAEGDVAVQIRDLDQSVIGNPAHDLIRLALSLETAARGSDLPGVTTARMIEQMVDGYAEALSEPDEDATAPEPDVVRSVRRLALGRRWRHLADDRIEGVDPEIPLGKRFWPITEEERAAIVALFEDEAVLERLMPMFGGAFEGKAVSVVDAAYWRKGCSSLGDPRYAVLIRVGKTKGRRGRLMLVDIKAAVPAVPPVAEGVAMPQDDGARVMAGACALAPNLGERMATAHLLGKPVVLRELKPQDLKLEVEQFSRAEAVLAARYLAHVVGLAHAAQMDAPTRRRWKAELLRHCDGDLDAPSWLWESVVSLAAAHEAGYLEHCRRYALESAAA